MTLCRCNPMNKRMRPPTLFSNLQLSPRHLGHRPFYQLGCTIPSQPLAIHVHVLRSLTCDYTLTWFRLVTNLTTNFLWFTVNQFSLDMMWITVISSWFTLYYLDTRIFSYSRCFVSMFSLSLDFNLSFVSLFSPYLDHDSCVMFYQAVLFLFALPGRFTR